MLTDNSQNRDFIEQAMKEKGMALTKSALKPFDAIPFEELHAIHDHEEAFLRDQIVDSIERAHAMRKSTTGGTDNVTARDVRTALLMVGSAVSSAPQSVFSNQSTIQRICPYCK